MHFTSRIIVEYTKHIMQNLMKNNILSFSSFISKPLTTTVYRHFFSVLQISCSDRVCIGSSNYSTIHVRTLCYFFAKCSFDLYVKFCRSSSNNMLFMNGMTIF